MRKKERCNFCKRLSDKLTLVNGNDYACESCGPRVVAVQVRQNANAAEVIETIWRVPKQNGRRLNVIYKGERRQLSDGKIYLS